MYINNPLGDLGKTPKWIKNIDRSVRDAGKYVDKSVRRVAEDVSAQHKRNRAKLAQAHRGTLKTLNLDDKTPQWMRKIERGTKRSSRKALVGASYVFPALGAQFGKHAKTRTRDKGAPGSVERKKYHDDVELAQRITTTIAATTAAVSGGVAAYSAYGAAGAATAGGAEAGGAAATAGKVGAALSTAASMGDKITDMLDPFNPDAIGNAPTGAEQSTTSTPKPTTNQIPWLPLALAVGFFLL